MIVYSESQNIWYSIVGTYQSEDSGCQIDITKNGYNIIIKVTRLANKDDVFGVVGFIGNKMELSASVGLPGIARFICGGPNKTDSDKVKFVFECTEYGLSLVFSHISSTSFSFSAGIVTNEVFSAKMRKQA